MAIGLKGLKSVRFFLIFFFFLKIKGWITGVKELKCFSLQWSKDLRARKGPFEISVFLKTVGCDLGHGTQWVKNVFLKTEGC